MRRAIGLAELAPRPAGETRLPGSAPSGADARRLVWAELITAFGLFSGCGAADGTPPPVVPEGTPLAELSPPALLDVGEILVDAVAVGRVSVRNVGDGPLRIRSAAVQAARPEVWRVAPIADVEIPPGEADDIQVEYRPCPAVWRELEPGSPCECLERVDAAILRIETNADSEPRLVNLTGAARTLGPRIEVDPPVELDLGVSTTATLSIRNSGCAPLAVSQVDLTGPSGAGTGARSDFFLGGCTRWPCSVQVAVCDEGCETQALELELTYVNDDPVYEELAELEIHTNDPVVEARRLLVSATGDPRCVPPIPHVETSTRPCVGRTVHLDGGRSEAAVPESPIVDFEWAFTFTQLPPPDLQVLDGGRRASFVPQRAGLYMVGLAVTSSCSAPGRWVEPVIVASTGCR